MKKLKHISRLSLAAIIALNMACKEKKTEEKLLRPVVFQEVSLNSGEEIRTFSGTAQTDKIINLSFRNSGIITVFNIRTGQVVRKGQLLAQLDNVQSRLAYEQSIAQMNSAESQMKTAKLNYDRIRSLYEKGSASLSDFENAKNSYQNAVSGFESAQRSVDIQKEQINFGYIYAPENGVIASTEAEIEENVNPGQVVAVLNAGNKMTISLGLPESVINQVQENMMVEIAFPAIQNKTFKGEVTEVAPAVNPKTATYPVKIDISDATEAIRSGMAANVTFNFSHLITEGLIIPAKAVGEDSNGRYVLLVDESSNPPRVKRQDIKIGRLTTAGFEVVSGLSQGQKIATAGLQTLLDGQEVKIQQ
ncbi:efflux RND transporter periplasmic adaptor subunit [Roseivirga pacifica]